MMTEEDKVARFEESIAGFGRTVKSACVPLMRFCYCWGAKYVQRPIYQLPQGVAKI